MNKKKYLDRIGIEDGNIRVDSANLKFLQKQHLLHIPFENLDIHWKRPIILNTKNFYEKIVVEKRGGFCYELNGLFCELLNELGFTSKIVSAQVFDGKDFSAEYDHLAILTKVDGESFLVDVGFGDFAAEPLKVILDTEQADKNGTFRLTKLDDSYFEAAKKDGENWNKEYIFKDSARDLAEFSEMCLFHQTSSESHFTRGKVCSLMTKNGRKTLTDDKFIETKKGIKTERKINSEKEFNKVLLREFFIKQIVRQ